MPTHPFDAAHAAAGSGALTGELVATDTTPATEVMANDYNAIWHGLRALVKQEQISGDLTAANGATDNSEGFVRLAKAVRRASRRLVEANIQMTGAALTFTPDLDTFAFKITEDGGGPYAGGAVYPAANAPTSQNRRLIFLWNGTTTNKVVGVASPQLGIVLQPGRGVLLYGTTVAGPATQWEPVGRGWDDWAFGANFLSCKVSNSGYPTEASSAANVYFLRTAGLQLTTLQIPLFSLTITTANNVLVLAPAAGGSLPASMVLNAGLTVGTIAPQWLVGADFAGTPTPLLMTVDTAGISFHKQDGTNFPTGTAISIYAHAATFAGNP